MNLDAINGSLFLRFAAVLAAYVQYGPDLGAVQKIWGATVPCLNEFVLDAFPVTLLAGASQLHGGLIHFQSFFLAHVRNEPDVFSNCHNARKGRRKVPMMLAPFLLFL
jgi:hypothetical protein